MAGTALGAPRLGSPATAADTSYTLVELAPTATQADAAALRSAGGTVVFDASRVYRLPTASSRRVVPGLRARGVVRLVEPDRLVRTLGLTGRVGARTVARATDFTDPLVPTEWWRAAIGVDTLTPPGPGKPVVIVDSGVDLTHPEFLNRPNLETLNPQEPPPIGGRHGTMVASVIGAPVNGVGVVGVYPEAVIRSWDASLGEGTQLPLSDIVAGIVAAADSGPAVINISLGTGRDPIVAQAIYRAVRKGSLVVAAAGNEGDTGSPPRYPATIPHVLTVAATDRNNQVSFFSSRSAFVDLAAPGEGITVAEALTQDWAPEDGTSFSSPIVAGSAAWVWTARPDLDATQLFEIMRRSATDIDAPGKDPASGYGLLNVPAALAYPTPAADPLEPNDDVDFLAPGGFFANGVPALTTKAQPATSVVARLDANEDPRDLYRVWLPRRGTLTATATADGSLGLGLWRLQTRSVIERRPGADRLARTLAAAKSTKLVFKNPGAAGFVYLAVTPARGVQEATYTLRVLAR